MDHLDTATSERYIFRNSRLTHFPIPRWKRKEKKGIFWGKTVPDFAWILFLWESSSATTCRDEIFFSLLTLPSCSFPGLTREILFFPPPSNGIPRWFIFDQERRGAEKTPLIFLATPVSFVKLPEKILKKTLLNLGEWIYGENYKFRINFPRWVTKQVRGKRKQTRCQNRHPIQRFPNSFPAGKFEYIPCLFDWPVTAGTWMGRRECRGFGGREGCTAPTWNGKRFGKNINDCILL